MFIPLMVFALTLTACAGLAAFICRARGRRHVPAVFWSVVGFLAAGVAIWSITPPEWTLTFPETLAASVDSVTYGHPVEHYAESLLVVMLVACAAGSALLGAIACRVQAHFS